MRLLTFVIKVELSQVLHVDQVTDLVIEEDFKDLDLHYLRLVGVFGVRIWIHHLKSFEGLL